MVPGTQVEGITPIRLGRGRLIVSSRPPQQTRKFLTADRGAGNSYDRDPLNPDGGGVMNYRFPKVKPEEIRPLADYN